MVVLESGSVEQELALSVVELALVVAGSEWESAVSESAPLAALESEFVVEA